jgi:subfamily B ATP-binding cassette protein HlyB/CyaB
MTLQENEVILRRYLDFDVAAQPETSKGIKDFTIDKIEFQSIHYSYIPNEHVLKDINLKMKKGEKIKIEGQNGSGKSTFSKILTTLYRPDSGAILINNRDIKFYDAEKVREKILLVTNEDILFNDTIYNNIGLGKNIEITDILDRAKEINFYDFIASKKDFPNHKDPTHDMCFHENWHERPHHIGVVSTVSLSTMEVGSFDALSL